MERKEITFMFDSMQEMAKLLESLYMIWICVYEGEDGVYLYDSLVVETSGLTHGILECLHQ